MLDKYLKERKKKKKILLMSHLVLGYPSLAANRATIDQMVDNGVDIMELQIPFSEPSADGPVIARANQAALDGGFKVRAGLDMVAETIAAHKIPFLLMTYYNILCAYGEERFIREAADIGVAGLIVPDLPLEYSTKPMALCAETGMSWIQLMTPTSGDERLAEIGQAGQGFVYCVARRGVTGKDTEFGDEVANFIGRCRQATPLPLAVGFGVKSAADVSYLAGKADIAVVGTAAITAYKKGGAEAVGQLFAGLALE